MERIDIVFYLQNGKVNFRVDGQSLPDNVKVLKRGELPGWAIRKGRFYAFLYDRYGTSLSFDSFGVGRCAFVNAFDDTEGDFIAAGIGTIYWGGKTEAPSEDRLREIIQKDLNDFNEDPPAEYFLGVVESFFQWNKRGEGCHEPDYSELGLKEDFEEDEIFYRV